MMERRHPCRRIARILRAVSVHRQDAGGPQARMPALQKDACVPIND